MLTIWDKPILSRRWAELIDGYALARIRQIKHLFLAHFQRFKHNYQ